MHMQYRISKPDEFLKLNDRDILEHANSSAHEEAIPKARLEYDIGYQEQISQPSEAVMHFWEALHAEKKPSVYQEMTSSS